MRFLKIFTIVIVSLVFLFYLLEFLSYSHYIRISYPFSGEGKPFKEYFLERLPEFFKNQFGNFDEKYENFYFRETMGTEYSETKPILLFGGSYSDGHLVEKEETFQNYIAEKTKSPVYNFSGHGWGPHNMLYQLKRDDFYSKFDKVPSSIVYVYMCGDSTFLFREVFVNEHQVFYRDSKDGLVRSSFSSGKPLYGYFARQMRRFYAEKFVSKEMKKNALIKHFLEARKEVNKRWGDVPFNILVYSYTPEDELIALEYLERFGFNVQYAPLIVNDNLGQVKYQYSEYDMHPNALAWELISPEFVKNMKRQ